MLLQGLPEKSLTVQSWLNTANTDSAFKLFVEAGGCSSATFRDQLRYMCLANGMPTKKILFKSER